VTSSSLRFFSARLYVWGISSSCAQACAVMVLFSVGVPALFRRCDSVGQYSYLCDLVLTEGSGAVPGDGVVSTGGSGATKLT
jgi:hypothetical protein